MPTSLAPARILVVDDGLTNRKLIQVILKRAGARVSLAENGQIGFEMAVRQSFHLILMDMQMPVMDGYTATRKLRDYGLDLPIIALTAHAMKGDEAKCRSAGCSGYLTKPIDAEELLATVAQSLNGQLEGGIDKEDEAGDQQSPVVTESESPILSTLPTDDPEFREIVEEFIEKFQAELAVMKERYHARDFAELARRAHWLKGSGGTAGFAALTDHARQLEQEASQRQVEAVERRLRLLAGLADRIAVSPQSVSSA